MIFSFIIFAIHYYYTIHLALKSILFITTSSISTNPRLLKSYLYWRNKGHPCKIVAFRLNNWADELDDALIEKHRFEITNIPADKQAFYFWLKASVLNRFLAFIRPSWLPFKLTAYASNKRSWQLMQYLKKNTFEFEHIEAHTLGALYPAFYWAKKKGIPFSFDVEDFHPEEKIDFQREKEKKRRYRLMQNLLPAANYITAASPLIGLEMEKLINRRVITINNTFPEAEFISPKGLKGNEKLKLIWFSQHISFGRGLEQFIEAAFSFKDQINLTLIGQLDDDFYQKIIQPNQAFIEVKKAMPQEDLHEELANYDVGLALEDGNEDYNREICLTNKIWAYFQAGLYILATKTKAQIEFMKDNTTHGVLLLLKNGSIAQALQKLLNEREDISSEREKRFQTAKKHAIEKEMEQLKGMIK